jgi:hypothetical protein
MHLTLSDNILWALGTGLKVFLCALVFYRRVYKRLPFFSIYVVMLLVEFSLIWSVYRVWGYTSRQAWYTAWYAVGVVLAARGLAVAELCWTTFRNYPALWSVVRTFLGFLALFVLVYAGITAYQNKTPLVAFFLTAERGSELSILIILTTLLALGLRYKIALGPVERNIALGFAFYSAFQVVNDSFMEHWMTRHFHWWNSSRVIAFDVALVIWVLPLRRALPPQSRTPALLSKEVAGNLFRQLLERMREITNELKSMSKWTRK